MNIQQINKTIGSYQTVKQGGLQGKKEMTISGKIGVEDTITLHHKADPNVQVNQVVSDIANQVMGKDNTQRISQLKQQVANNTYFIQSEVLADKILEGVLL